jgi:hypothetical protein
MAAAHTPNDGPATMAKPEDSQASPETFLVAPRSPGPEGMAALARLFEQVRGIPGARAEPPAQLPGLAMASPRLRLTLPRGAAGPLQAEHGGALIFDADAELRY